MGRADRPHYQAHEAGIKVIHMVNTRGGRQVASDGADVIIAQGTEGEATSDDVHDVARPPGGRPGRRRARSCRWGIADGRGLAAALMLGARVR